MDPRSIRLVLTRPVRLGDADVRAVSVKARSRTRPLTQHAIARRYTTGNASNATLVLFHVIRFEFGEQVRDVLGASRCFMRQRLTQLQSAALASSAHRADGSASGHVTLSITRYGSWTLRCVLD